MIDFNKKDFRLCAFADEASPSLDGQIAALKRNNIKLLEIRNVDGKSVVDLTDDELRAIRTRLDAEGITVWSIGSSVGKTRFEEREEHERRFERSLRAAELLGAKNIRIFSFYVRDKYEMEVLAQDIFAELQRMVDIASERGVTLCHENEKGIYGAEYPRVLELLGEVEGLGCVFDPANYIQCGEEFPHEFFYEFSDDANYLHIKDALRNGTVVPAGEGDAGMRSILRSYRLMFEGRVLSVEPHLYEFVGLSGLQDEELKHKFSYASADEAFDAAVNALKKLLDGEGITYE